MLMQFEHPLSFTNTCVEAGEQFHVIHVNITQPLAHYTKNHLKITHEILKKGHLPSTFIEFLRPHSELHCFS